ncbi:MAG: type I methionyl aminopeptidase [Patescibacteria group bacterium]
MIRLKTEEEIKRLKAGGRVLNQILKKVLAQIKPGITTKQLDDLAEKLIIQAGGVPSFKNYKSRENDPPFLTALCVSVNNELVHAPAGSRIIQAGDLVTIDVGMKYDGLYTDMAETVAVGKVSQEAKKLMKVTQKALVLAIKQVKPGNYLADISKAIQDYVEGHGFFVVKDLVGHGVGYAVHEEPSVPNFVNSSHPPVELKEGLVIAIEPMVIIGTDQIMTLDDGWTVVTANDQLCAHFEHTVAVVKGGCLIITN